MAINLYQKTHLKPVRFRFFLFLNTFNIKHQLLTEVWADGSILVESPLLPVLPMFCPEGNFGPRHVSAPNDIQTGIVGLRNKERSEIQATEPQFCAWLIPGTEHVAVNCAVVGKNPGKHTRNRLFSTRPTAWSKVVVFVTSFL